VTTVLIIISFSRTDLSLSSLFLCAEKSNDKEEEEEEGFHDTTVDIFADVELPLDIECVDNTFILLLFFAIFFMFAQLNYDGIHGVSCSIQLMPEEASSTV
jgi:hypothetical protein